MSGPETSSRKFLLIGPVTLIILLIGVLAAPHLVYDQFIWQYFWGPIVADAGTGTLAECPAHISASTGLDVACHNSIVAHSGYTLINEIGYGAILIYLLFLLVTTLKRLEVGEERNFVLYFVPFIIGGGMLRVVEDVTATHPDLIGFPLQYFLISPLIYLIMFGTVFATLLCGVILERKMMIPDYKHLIAGSGTVFTLGILAVILRYTSVSASWMFPATMGGAAVILAVYTLVLRGASSRFPGLSRITDSEGLIVLYGHLLDGVSTALSLDMLGMLEKHPVPQALISYTGTPYSFIAVKLGVITLILYYMDDEVRSDDPLFFNLILLGILAVGMGPGIRNMTRAIFGV